MMFSELSFLFQLLVIGFYTLVYALVSLFVLYLLSGIPKLNRLKKIMRSKTLCFSFLFLAYGIAFTYYSLSYWQDRGFGDSYKLPIGNGYYINNIDGAETFFEDEKKTYSRQASLTDFLVKDGRLCARFYGFNSRDCEDCYIVFDTKQSAMREFHSANEYEAFAGIHDLPHIYEFRDFFKNYNEHWQGHDKWYLP